MIYVILILILFLFAQSEIFTNKRCGFQRRKIYVILVMITCAVLMGLRGNKVGIDTVNYVDLYHDVKGYSIRILTKEFYWGSIECGFVLLNKIFSLIYDNYNFYQCALSIIYYYFSYKFIINNVTKPRIACLLFVCLGLFLLPFNITRQMLAVVIAANSFTYLLKDKKYIALFLIILASTIHTTALLALIIPIFYYLKDIKILVKLFPVLSILVIVSYQHIVFLVSSLTVKYASYYENDLKVQEAGLGRVVWVIIYVIALYVVYSKKFDSTKKIVANLVMIYVAFGYVGTLFNYFERLGYYFLPFQILLLLNFGDSIRYTSIRRSFYLFICVGFMILFILSSQASQYSYVTFF